MGQLNAPFGPTDKPAFNSCVPPACVTAQIPGTTANSYCKQRKGGRAVTWAHLAGHPSTALCDPSPCPALIPAIGWVLQSHPALTPVSRKPFTQYCICPLPRLNVLWLGRAIFGCWCWVPAGRAELSHFPSCLLCASCSAP